ncbi:MAG: LytTR family transcriptional regulator [Sphingomonadales bacterium]|nr:LytTR family transcriptional regulator [Sphingomonadales bacterium]
MSERDGDKAWRFFFRHQTAIEIGLWAAFLITMALVNATSVLMEAPRIGRTLLAWEPFIWEFSSAIGVGALIPAVLWIDRRYPFTAGRWLRYAVLHLGLSAAFSLAHVAIMVGLRKLVYRLYDRLYDFGNVPVELIYEYRKDLVTYVLILVVAYSYRAIVARGRGTASLEAGSGTAPAAIERVLVKTRQGRRLVRFDDVDWLEAAGNYVGLHVGGDTFLLRATLGGLADRLDPARFARIHRSFVVNLDRVAEIRSTDSGDYRVRLTTGNELNMSRRYRANLDHLAVA